MSLSLVAGYSSEEEKVDERADDSDESSGGEDESSLKAPVDEEPDRQEQYAAKGGSLLPSPDYLFSEVTGPPEYLRTSSAQPGRNESKEFRQRSQPDNRAAKWQGGAERRQALPEGAVMESKPKLASTYNQVQIETADGGSRAAASTNLKRSIIAPENMPTKDEEKRNKSTTKDKEKSKRMKGQSSHATWKSETEMHLRQQFD